MLIANVLNSSDISLLFQFLLSLPTCLSYPFLLAVFPVHGSCPVSYQSLNRVTASLLLTTVLSPFSQLLVNSLKDSSTKTSSNISELITSSLPGNLVFFHNLLPRMHWPQPSMTGILLLRNAKILLWPYLIWPKLLIESPMVLYCWS